MFLFFLLFGRDKGINNSIGIYRAFFFSFLFYCSRPVPYTARSLSASSKTKEIERRLYNMYPANPLYIFFSLFLLLFRFHEFINMHIYYIFFFFFLLPHLWSYFSRLPVFHSCTCLCVSSFYNHIPPPRLLL